MQQTYITEPARRTPALEADVFIAGAGTAGCIAAIAAARAGASVVLVEKTPVPGGTYTNGGIGTYSFFSCNEDSAASKRIVGGIPYELAQRLTETGGATGFMLSPQDHYRSGYRFVADHEAYKGVISQMLLEAGVTVLLQTMFCGVQREGSRITAAIIENKDGRSAVCAKQYIDASGDGDIARFAGLEQVEVWQDYDKVSGAPTGLVFGMAGIDFDRFLAENSDSAFVMPTMPAADGRETRRISFTHQRHPDKYKPLADLDIRFFTSIQSLHDGEATYINNSKGAKIDATDAKAYSKAELEQRVKILQMAQAFKACVPGFEDAWLSWAAVQLGVRASRITLCDKILSSEEISGAARFDDEIGLYGFHDFAPKHPELFVKAPGYYGMPYRMLLAKGCENLYMAGRCVTTDIVAHMSTRNTVGCMVMGQGAGVAAALCARKGCGSRSLPYPELRSELLEQGVILDV